MSGIPVFVINLDRRTDRLASIKQRLEAEGLEWFRIAAVDGQKISSSILEEVYSEVSKEYPPTIGEMACALSHRKAWEAFLESDRQALCVAEDDILFTPEFSSLLTTSDWVTSDLGIIKLDDNGSPKRPILLKSIKKDLQVGPVRLFQLWSRVMGAGAYIAHREVVETIVTEFSRLNAPIDQHLFNPTFSRLLRKGLVTLAIPPVVYHNHEGSDLQFERVSKLSGSEAETIKMARRFENRRNLLWKAFALFRGARFYKIESLCHLTADKLHVGK